MILSSSESPYIDIENISCYLQQYENDFILLSLNIQSLNAKFDVFQSLLTELSNSNIFVSAICIQESWVSTNQEKTMFDIPSYNAFFLPTVCSSHSGLVTYIHNSYQCNVLNVYKPCQIGRVSLLKSMEVVFSESSHCATYIVHLKT